MNEPIRHFPGDLFIIQIVIEHLAELFIEASGFDQIGELQKHGVSLCWLYAWLRWDVLCCVVGSNVLLAGGTLR